MVYMVDSFSCVHNMLDCVCELIFLVFVSFNLKQSELALLQEYSVNKNLSLFI